MLEGGLYNWAKGSAFGEGVCGGGGLKTNSPCQEPQLRHAQSSSVNRRTSTQSYNLRCFYSRQI